MKSQKAKTRRLTIFFILLLSSCSIFSQSESEKLINKLERQRFTASVNEDFDFLKYIFSDKLEYCRSSGVINNKSEYLATIRSHEVIYTELSPESIVSKQYATNVVISRGTVKISVKAQNNDGKPYLLYFTSVYIKEKGGWKIVSLQSTKVLSYTPL